MVLPEEAPVCKLLQSPDAGKDAGLRSRPGKDEGIADTKGRTRSACLEQALGSDGERCPHSCGLCCCDVGCESCYRDMLLGTTPGCPNACPEPAGAHCGYLSALAPWQVT